jgi:hypothetical protein
MGDGVGDPTHPALTHDRREVREQLGGVIVVVLPCGVAGGEFLSADGGAGELPGADAAGGGGGGEVSFQIPW